MIEKCIEGIKYLEQSIAETKQLKSELLKTLDPIIKPLEDNITKIKYSMFKKGVVSSSGQNIWHSDIMVENYAELRLQVDGLEKEIRIIKDAFYEEKIKLLDEKINQFQQAAFRDRMKLNKMLQQHVKSLVDDYFSPRVILY